MSNEKWSQKPIITNPTESTRICLIDGSPVVENKTISVNDLLATVNKPLDLLPQLFYRNLEGDNMLATEDFEGQVRPTETPITLIDWNYANNTIIVANMPHIGELMKNPDEWMIGYAKYPSESNTSISLNSSIRILNIEYLGEYNSYTNCYRLTLKKSFTNVAPTAHLVGQRMFVCSFLANGMELKWEPAFKSTMINGDWNRMVTSVGSIFKHSDGTYRAIVGGYTAFDSSGTTLPFYRRYTMKLYKSDTRFGTWTNQGNNLLEGIFDDVLPSGSFGYGNAAQTIPHPTKKGSYLMFIGLYNNDTNTSSTTALHKFGIIEFDENLQHKRVIEITHDYTPTIGINVFGYGTSIAYYKGKYFISFHDGSPNTGKRVILSSKKLEGPYSLDSVVFDWSAEYEYKQPGSMIGNSIANSTLYVYNNELYHFTSGEGVNTASGNQWKHECFLFKYDDEGNWNFVKGPVVLSLHGDKDNYPEISSWIGYSVPSAQHESGGWGSAHLGQMNFFEVEGNKLWMAYGTSGWGQHALVSYQVTIGYINLAKALN